MLEFGKHSEHARLPIVTVDDCEVERCVVELVYDSNILGEGIIRRAGRFSLGMVKWNKSIVNIRYRFEHLDDLIVPRLGMLYAG